MATQKTIEKLLAYSGFDGDTSDVEVEEIEELLYEADAQEVDESFTEGSRWSNYRTTVYRVVADEPDGREFFFAAHTEVPATEMQDGGDFSYEFNEVYKTEKTVIVYE